MTRARLNVQVAYIPLLSSYIGENFFASQEADKQFVVRANYVGQPQQDKDIGIPMPTYAENILPTTQGWESVNYSYRQSSLPGAKFDRLINLKSGTETNILYSPANGKDYVNYAGGWVRGSNSPEFAGVVTHAYIKLRAFVFYERQRLLEYDYPTRVFKDVQFIGLERTNIDGILNANNYLVAWNDTTVFWSSTLDPLDFEPSLSSGAGSQNPTQVRGSIVACLPTADGFIIYTTANAVSAAWSGNIRYPWVFKEVAGSAGIRQIEHVTYESNYDGHFAWTTAGLQIVSKAGAKPIYPEVTDFLVGRLVEEYIGPTAMQSHHNEANTEFESKTQDFTERVPGPHLLQQLQLAQDPWVKLSMVGTRFFCISYGFRDTSYYDYVLVYDASLERWGKLKIRHVDIFHYIHQNYEQPETKIVIGILQIDGTVQTVEPSQWGIGTGVLLYGRLQERNGRWLQLNEIACTTIKEDTPQVLVIPSYTGTELLPSEVPYLAVDLPNTKEWYSRVSGKSMNILFLGSFSFSGIYLNYTRTGTR